MDFADRPAAVTGGRTGMGHELARRLTAERCHAALCDVSAETLSLIAAGFRAATFVADVANKTQLIAIRDAAAQRHAADHIYLSFKDAGSSLFTNSRGALDIRPTPETKGVKVS